MVADFAFLQQKNWVGHMHLNTIFAPKAGWKVKSMCVPLQTELWSRFGSKGNIIESLATC